MERISKKCPECGIEKSSDEFTKRTDRRDGLDIYCKICKSKLHNQWENERKINDPERYKKVQHGSRIKKTYGITLEQYDQMFEQQGGVCAICGNIETKTILGVVQRLSVDHNHETGKVRGLLCASCNMILGFAKESQIRLQSAINYLYKHQED